MNFLLKRKKPALFCPAGGGTSPKSIKKNIKQIMRISAVIIFLTGMSTLVLQAAPGKAQALDQMKMSITVKDEMLSSVLKRIEHITNLHFVYPSAKIDYLKVDAFATQNTSVQQTLDKLLQPMGLIYRQIG